MSLEKSRGTATPPVVVNRVGVVGTDLPTTSAKPTSLRSLPGTAIKTHPDLLATPDFSLNANDTMDADYMKPFSDSAALLHTPVVYAGEEQDQLQVPFAMIDDPSQSLSNDNITANNNQDIIIFEETLPVVWDLEEQPLNNTAEAVTVSSNGAFPTDFMACYNPCEVEGLEQQQQTVVELKEEPVEEPNTSVVSRKNVKNLKLEMPVSEDQLMAEPEPVKGEELDTPSHHGHH